MIHLEDGRVTGSDSAEERAESEDDGDCERPKISCSSPAGWKSSQFQVPMISATPLGSGYTVALARPQTADVLTLRGLAHFSTWS